MKQILQILEEALSPYSDQHHFWVAYSGGLDSHVLLDAAAKVACNNGWRLSALHVNHGLSQFSDTWARHCQAKCAQLGVTCKVLKVEAEAEQGESPEAKARAVRYQAIDEQLGSKDVLLLAQHQDDQLETFLLQLLRGAGPAGLSAMPKRSQRQQAKQLRPFLSLERATLEAYASEVGLNWVEDDSNRDTCFDRNYLRHNLVPLLKQRWPEASKTFSRAARHQAEVQVLQEDLAKIDAQRLELCLGERLDTRPLSRLTIERQKNLLRFWLKKNQIQMPSEKVLNTLLSLLGEKTAKHEVTFAKTHIRKYRNTLYLLKADQNEREEEIDWTTHADLFLPNINTVLTRDRLQQMQVKECHEPLQVKFRQGGERFKIVGREGSRTLKKFFQEEGIPHWQRHKVPLIYHESKLVAIYGYCACE